MFQNIIGLLYHLHLFVLAYCGYVQKFIYESIWFIESLNIGMLKDNTYVTLWEWFPIVGQLPGKYFEVCKQNHNVEPANSIRREVNGKTVFIVSSRLKVCSSDDLEYESWKHGIHISKREILHQKYYKITKKQRR